MAPDNVATVASNESRPRHGSAQTTSQSVNGSQPHVVVLGAGIAGVAALRQLKKAPVRVTIVDRKDAHVFLPLLYQVATNQLGPDHISTPAARLASEEHAAFLQAEATEIHLGSKQVYLRGREPIDYAFLLIATGAEVEYFGTPGASEYAYPLYTLDNAVQLKSHITSCFDLVRDNPMLAKDGLLNFCVAGGGATGVEATGAIAELIKMESGHVPQLSDAGPAVHLYEARPELMATFEPKLRVYANEALGKRGLQVHLGEAVDSVERDRIGLRSGGYIKSHTLVWSAGLKPGNLAASLSKEPGRRPKPERDLSAAGHPEVFFAGDFPQILDDKVGTPPAQLGSVALQSGSAAGRNIALLATGKPTKPFQYKDKGSMAIVGRGDAVVQFRSGRTLTGRSAWIAWRALHLILLRGGEQKAHTLLEWGKDRVGRRSSLTSPL